MVSTEVAQLLVKVAMCLTLGSRRKVTASRTRSGRDIVGSDMVNGVCLAMSFEVSRWYYELNGRIRYLWKAAPVTKATSSADDADLEPRLAGNPGL